MAYIGQRTQLSASTVLNNADSKTGFRFQASQSFTATKMAGYMSGNVTTSGEKFRFGIYSDSSGSPGALLGYTEEMVGTGQSRWFIGNLVSSVSITGTSYYWLAIISDSQVGFDIAATTGGTCRVISDTYSDGFADPFGSGTSNTYNVLIYATDEDVMVLGVENFTPATNNYFSSNLYVTIPPGTKSIIAVSSIYDTSPTDGVLTAVSYEEPTPDENFSYVTEYYDATCDGHVAIYYINKSDLASGEWESEGTADQIFRFYANGTCTDMMCALIFLDKEIELDATATPATGNGSPSITWSTIDPDTIAVIAALTDQATSTNVTATSGTTSIYVEDLGSDTGAAGYAIRTASGSQTLSFTDTNNDEDWVAVGAAFKEYIPTASGSVPAYMLGGITLPFHDGFEDGTTDAWKTSQSLVEAGSAISGSYGIRIDSIIDRVENYFAGTGKISIGFWMEINTIALDSAENIAFAVVNPIADDAKLIITHDGSSYYFYLYNGTESYSSYQFTPDAIPHWYEVHWDRETGGSSYAELWIDDTRVISFSDTKSALSFTEVRIGVAASSGTVTWDADFDEIFLVADGRATPNSSVPCYLEGGTGGTATSDSQAAYLKGQDTVSGSQDAYLAGALDTSSNTPAYTAGGIVSTTSLPVYLEGSAAPLWDIDHEDGTLNDYDNTLGGVSVTGAAALVGSYGLQIVVSSGDTSDDEVTVNYTISTNQIRLRFYFDYNSMNIPTGTYQRMIQGYTDGSLGFSTWLYFGVEESGGNIQAYLTSADDTGSTHGGNRPVVTDAPHWVEVWITRASSAVAGDGEIRWWLDGVEQTGYSTLDNYDVFPTQNQIRWGNVNRSGSTVNGTFYMDDFIANDTGDPIGPFGTEISDSQAAYLKGLDTTSDSETAYLAGSLNTSDSFASFLQGSENTTDSQAAYLAGLDTASSNINAYLLGSQDDIDSVPGYTSGHDTATATQQAYLSGSDSSSSQLQSYLEAWATTETSTPAYLAGQDTASQAQAAYLRARDDAWDSNSGYTKGQESLTSSLAAYLSGVADAISSTPAYLSGGIITTASLQAYLNGDAILASDTSPAYTAGLNTTADIQPAYTRGSDTASDSQTAYLVGSQDIAGAQEAYTKGSDNTQSSTPVYLSGSSTDLDVLSAYLVGQDSSQSNIWGNTTGQDTSQASVNAYLVGGIVSTDSEPAYTHGKLDDSSSLWGFIWGAEETSTSLACMTHGSADTSTSQSAYLVGSEDTSSSTSGYARGSQDSTSWKYAYTHGQSAQTSAVPGYIIGGITATDSAPAYMLAIGEWLIPDGDIVTGSWKREDESSTDLYVSIDEMDASDADYVYEANILGGDFFEVNLSDPTGGTVGDGDVTIWWRGKATGGSTVTMRVQLREGTNIIAEKDEVFTASENNYTYTLSAGEKSSITDWTNLRLRFIVQAVV